MDKQVELEEIEAFFQDYLDSYFKKRNFHDLEPKLGDDLHGIGTGLHEVAQDRQAANRIFQQDLQEAPDPIEYSLLSLTITRPFQGVGYITSELNLKTVIEEQPVSFQHLRMSLAVTKDKDAWLVRQLHVSFPTAAHEAGESYPVKKLKEQKEFLERVVEEKTAQLEAALRKSAHQANTDQLTGLKNRYFMDQALKEAVSQALELGSPLSLIMLDVDHFKTVNDSFGHQEGDVILKKFATALTTGLPESCTLARWGGEEFLILCPDQDVNQALELVKSIQLNLRSVDFRPLYQVTASFGVTQLEAGDSLDSLLLRADKGLYLAKSRGRDQAATFRSAD